MPVRGRDTVTFLHLLANFDAYACLLDDSDVDDARVDSRAHVVTFADEGIRLSYDSLRPTSAYSNRESTCNGDARPKSGKSLTFQLSQGRNGSPVSISTAEYKTFLSNRDSKTPVSMTKVAQSPDGYTSGRTTQMSSVREGVRSPTATSGRDMTTMFADVDPDEWGMIIWRIQGSNVRQIDENEHGFFHEANAYIILNISSKDYEKSLHYWIGSQASENDAELAEKKAHQLDQIISSAHLFSRETQGFESTVFLRLFEDGIVYTEGKHKQGVGKSSRYDKRLYLVTGRKYARAACVYPRKDYIQSSNILILDSYPRVYVWIGHDTPYILKTKAIHLASKIQRQQRNGKCHIVVIDEADTKLNDAFRRKFDNDPVYPVVLKSACNGSDPEQTTNDKDEELRLVLYRVSGERVLYDMPEAAKRPLQHCYLVKRDSFLLDRGSQQTLYMWVGNNAMEDEVNYAIRRSKTFSQHRLYPGSSTVCRVREDHEPVEFKRCFTDWRDKLTKERSITKRYSAGNVGRALFSSTDKRTIATLKECWSEDTVGDFQRSTQMWVLNGGELEDWEHTGLFTNNKCFLVLHTTIEVSYYRYVVYYWLGKKATDEDRQQIVQLSLNKNTEIENTAIVIRVLDGKEPAHFMVALGNRILVYDGDETAKENVNVKMFCVREFHDCNVKIQQVQPTWPSLNSSASFVILTEPEAYLWYGKKSGSTAREAAKDLLGMLSPDRMYSAEILTERKETEGFQVLLGGCQNYEEAYKEKILERRCPCLVYCQNNNTDFELVPGFTQEDLSEEDVFILDTFDQISVWFGERVDDSRRQIGLDIAKRYLRFDATARDFSLVSVWMVAQRSEPQAFSKYFPVWNALGYSGRHSYEILRKKIRQENARIEINENQIIDTSYKGQPKYPYRLLLKYPLPNDVDVTNKHNHLSQKGFRENLKLSRQEFYSLPAWKQRQILCSARLMFNPAKDT